jgi:hypothetical protein
MQGRYIHLFPQEYLDLQQELRHHPDIVELLQKHEGDLHLGLAEIAAHFNIILDGQYFESDLTRLAEILTKKLYEKRTLIITDTGPHTLQ